MKKFKITAQKSAKISEIVKENLEYINYHSLQKIFRKKDIKLNGVRISNDIKVSKNDELEIFCPDNEMNYYAIVYQDENLVIINKKAGIIVQGKDKTKPNELAVQDFLEKDLKQKVYPLHRLDRNTAGLVIFCKTQKAFNNMKKCMELGEVEKFYLAEVYGKYNLNNDEFYAYLTKNNLISKVFVSSHKDNPEAMPITTIINLLEIKKDSSMLEIQIKNGKTHQIRAHLAYLGFPLVGDNKYGNKVVNQKAGTRKQKLVAYKIAFNVKNGPMKYLNDIKLELKNEN